MDKSTGHAPIQHLLVFLALIYAAFSGKNSRASSCDCKSDGRTDGRASERPTATARPTPSLTFDFSPNQTNFTTTDRTRTPQSISNRTQAQGSQPGPVQQVWRRRRVGTQCSVAVYEGKSERKARYSRTQCSAPNVDKSSPMNARCDDDSHSHADEEWE